MPHAPRLMPFLIALFLSGAALAAPEALPHATETAIHQSVDGEVTAVEGAADIAEHHEAAGPPQFAVETFPSQIFWLTVTFASMYLLFSGAALPRIKQGLDARAAHIQGLLNDARRLHDEAERHRHDMNSASDAAHQKAHDMLNKAAVESQDIANRRNHELEAVLQTKIRASEERIASARANAVQSVREASQILLPVILGRFADMKLPESEIARLVHENDGPKTNGVRGAA